MRATSIAALVLLLAALAGCGSEGAPEGGALRAAIDAVPGDRGVTAVDLAVVRTQLGLPDDAGMPAKGGRDFARTRLAVVAGTALPFLSTLDPALVKAIDLRAVRQAATGGLTQRTRVTAIRFDSAAGDVLQRLGQLGWKKRGDVFESPDGGPVAQFAGQGRDELVLLSPSLAALQRARQGKAPGGRVRALVSSLKQPSRVAVALGSSGCLSVIGGGDALKPPSGQVVVVPRRPPVRSRLATGRRLGEVRLAAAKIEGDRVVADYSGAPRQARGLVASQLIQRFQLTEVYRCR